MGFWYRKTPKGKPNHFFLPRPFVKSYPKGPKTTLRIGFYKGPGPKKVVWLVCRPWAVLIRMLRNSLPGDFFNFPPLGNGSTPVFPWHALRNRFFRVFPGTFLKYCRFFGDFSIGPKKTLGGTLGFCRARIENPRKTGNIFNFCSGTP